MSAALVPHCWNATSFADPEYVIDLTSPSAFCAFAMTAFASCAAALPHSAATESTTRVSFLNTATPPISFRPAAPHEPGCAVLLGCAVVYAKSSSACGSRVDGGMIRPAGTQWWHLTNPARFHTPLRKRSPASRN